MSKPYLLTASWASNDDAGVFAFNSVIMSMHMFYTNRETLPSSAETWSRCFSLLLIYHKTWISTRNPHYIARKVSHD